jgi:O-6-methylguanine DNA methyltransferase
MNANTSSIKTKNPEQANSIFFTKFQFQVYQLCSQIPKGYISTYKQIAKILHTSPRAVGRALRNNPFASIVVPCHRVIESNFFIGGYRGQTARGKVIRPTIKQKKLIKEGVFFNPKGYLQKEFRKDKIFEKFEVLKLAET